MRIFPKLRVLASLAATALTLTPSHAILDANINGMSDLWEKQHNNGSLYPPTFLPNDDPDQDGWTNATEAVAGTDPALANPPDGIIATSIESTTSVGAFTITWSTIVGKNYRLQASSNLTNWLNVGTNIVGTSNSHTLGISAVQPDTTVPPKLFWRVVASDLDTDGDGLTNAEENAIGTDPEKTDTDSDGADDKQETVLGTNATSSDTDGDGATDGDELFANTDPKSDQSHSPQWRSINRTLAYDFQDYPIEDGGREGQLRTIPTWNPSLTYTADLATEINWPALHLELESHAPYITEIPPGAGPYGTVQGEAQLKPSPPCYHASLQHQRIWLEIKPPAVTDITRQALVRTERTIDAGDPVITYEPVEFLIQAGETKSEPLDLNPDFTTNPSDNQAHTENVKKEIILADLDFIKPGTEIDPKPTEIAEDKEDTEGEVVNVNWDDDNNSEGDGGHGKIVFKNDFDDANGTENEDDMIQLKIHQSTINGATARLKYDNTHIKLWSKKDRKDEIISEQTEISLAADTIIFLEGRKLTLAESAKIIELQFKAPDANTYATADKVSIHVATPIMLFSGVNPDMSNEEAYTMIQISQSNETLLGKRRKDNRINTVIFSGKNQSAKDLFYSVDVLTANLTEEEAAEDKTAGEDWPGRLVSKDKEMKIALALEGAHVVFSGHSNYGLGPNFMKVGVQTVDDFMNVSNFGIAGIVLKEKVGDLDFSNPMKEPDHGGPQFSIRATDIKDTVENQWVTFPGFNQRRFPGDSASFTRKAGGGGYADYHFVTEHEWATIVGSNGDLPTLRYASLFMHSCNSGRHFGITFNRKPFIYTLGESYSFLQDSEELDELDSLAGSYIFIEGVILGKDFGEIVSFLNKHRKLAKSSPGGLYSVSE